MYTDFFSLTEKPFSITPDPAYLFLSNRHEEALAHLIYGVTDSGGFIQLTGEVGTGKTIVIRSLFEQLPDNVDIALILNPRLTVNEFLQSICDELDLHLGSDPSNKTCIDALNPFLLNAHANGRKVVLLVDEAQNLSVEVLEQIRLLTNLETHKDKLLQIILVGQPELDDLLQRQDLRQLAQRITARYYLMPLNKAETGAYIKHRLSVAGAKYNIFKPAAENLIFKESGGVPRLVNVIADRALLGAFSEQQPTVNAKIAKQAIKEVMGTAKTSINEERATPIKISPAWRWKWLAIPVIAITAFATWQLTPSDNGFKASLANLLQSKQTSNVNETIPPTPSISASNEGQVIESSVAKLDTESISKVEKLISQTTDSTTDLASLLETEKNNTTAENAFNELLVIWGRSKFYDHTNACENVKVLGLRCLYQQGDWTKVSDFNRPVILELTDSQNIKHQLLISSQDGDIVTVNFSDKKYTMALSEILDAWTGSYLVFWQPERLDVAGLYWGQESDAVVWLREKLTGLGMNIEPQSQSQMFDADLVTSVKNFQRSVGLVEDGIVGSRTFLYFNNVLDLPNRPYLKGSN